MDAGYSTIFDGDSGVVYITGGQACWTELMDVITATNEFLSEQLELFEENGIYLNEIFEWEGWEFPGKDEFDLFVRELDEYTDG